MIFIALVFGVTRAGIIVLELYITQVFGPWTSIVMWLRFPFVLVCIS